MKVADESLLLRAEEAARLCGISQVTWRRWDASARTPPSYRVGGARLWRRADLVSWIADGMPDQKKWLALHPQAGGRR